MNFLRNKKGVATVEFMFGFHFVIIELAFVFILIGGLIAKEFNAYDKFMTWRKEIVLKTDANMSCEDNSLWSVAGTGECK